eukprot:TRINITY_DN2128_c0_g1_i1.p1 TRINITY_DN2128_c0_g1~~TRINITY_DN2128_c0_g1_i1.p1  ORF type:complete len:349 (+),score=100.39 TRINITY_DN2128_c0_g1_i1:89-1048(+)
MVGTDGTAPDIEAIKREVAERRQLLSSLPSHSQGQKVKFVRKATNLASEEVTIAEDADKTTIYFSQCKGSTFTVKSNCSKVLIKDCEDCVITFDAVVITQVVELWHSKTVTLRLNTPVLTLQADLGEEYTFEYSERSNMGDIVWAGVKKLKCVVKSAGANGNSDETLETGLDEMMEVYDDVREDITQFYVRYVHDKLSSEKLVRLDNGYPTTQREKRRFDQKSASNERRAEAYVRGVVKIHEKEGGINKKQGRNDPCACESGKKYKACCGDPAKAAKNLAEPDALKDLGFHVQPNPEAEGAEAAVSALQDAAASTTKTE